MYITIEDDFDLQKIADSGQCFRVKCFNDDTYRFITGENVLYIRKADRNTPEPHTIGNTTTEPDRNIQKETENRYEISCTEEVWNRVWYPYFDLGRSYREVRERIKSRDKYMLAAAENGLGIRILRQEPWEMLITFIISQQKTIPAIKNAVETLCKNYGTKLTAIHEEIYCFPSATQLSGVTEELLREYKLGYRAPYVLDAINKVHHQDIDLYTIASYTDRKLFEALKQVSGVGDKVSNCICLFAYGRTRLAPVDTWIKKVIDQKYKGKNPFPKYRDAAGIMQQYIFYYAQTHKGEF